MATILTFLIALFPPLADNVPAPFVEAMPVCEYEDGNTDGTACIFDGRWYVDSSNYR
ncbi:hypothetical protein SEA_STROSAHL_91 [Gordonia phage Strosahl]|uniref:Uncharacterized protein n=2 Tax=Soupsvirus strosahl TaxID=2560510 RepID=A0A1B3B1B8_9CAUD|nr:hypothetical protein BIZ67_gp019 [Gordonia phage Remus]YP_009596292.1 hypothetical protein FDH03_gp019 [Gordonia phage Strosahl]QFP95155.1 hypothetical protein SEA_MINECRAFTSTEVE_91 [Gordonia phage MinecraftSteve]QWS67871.1 hypothetical protein SEA_DEKHOCKEY33_92 [Gordonia phage DekHockey33]QZD98735.1 hypothetical protein SEA_LOOPER_87 [Gordonia phage Looper]WIC40183.1 hypothetical protein SEA_BATTLESHIP_93 [Gordonia phage Battleship]AOE44695.1 hypothetical protein SEA_REMUS_91 [Gordonia p